MMAIQENFIKMKIKPIPKELINKIELRVEDIQITPREKKGFEGYLLKNVLVPYVGNERVGYFTFLRKENRYNHFYEIRYRVSKGRLTNTGSPNQYNFSRVAYIMLNKDDPRVIETEDHYDIVDNLMVDHDEDIELQDRKFIVKPDTKKNLQLLTTSQNANKGRKKMSNLPRNVKYDHLLGAWKFCIHPNLFYGNKKAISKSFSILKHGYVGAYLKVMDTCNEITGSNHIPDLKHIDETLPSDYKTMKEKDFFDKYYKKNHLEYRLRYKKNKQMNSDVQLDLGLSLT